MGNENCRRHRFLWINNCGVNPEQQRLEEEIFHGALLAASPEGLEAYLDRACGEDSELRRNVEDLLRAHEFCPDILKTELDDCSLPLEKGYEKPGDRIGRYTLVEQIGEGGCGTVWKAEQLEPVRREVALKVIKFGMDTRSVVARFEAERQALAMMDHPHIARVFDGGATAVGRPYFVMELVRGQPITEYCDNKRLTLRKRLALFVHVCRAVQHAHQKGVIHRDLKPANILVAECDGHAIPKVIDFGVAKAIEQPLAEATRLTVLGQIMGTPAYMSPEQAGLEGLDIDTRSDVYSLGAVLYELLTGSTPVDARQLIHACREAILRVIREEEPPLPSTKLGALTSSEADRIALQRRSVPRKLTRRLRGELDWIVMKALEKDRTGRYDTANGLAMDIERYLSGHVVLASPPGVAYQIIKWVRRNRTLALATVLVAGTLVTATVVSTRLARLALDERDKVERLASESRARWIQLAVTHGLNAMERNDSYAALLWFTEALRLGDPESEVSRIQRLRIGALLEYSPSLTQFWVHEHGIKDAALSPDGRLALTVGYDKTVRLRDIVNQREGPVLTHPKNISSAAFSSNGRLAVSVCEDGAVQVWNTETGELASGPFQHAYPISHALITPDGRLVFTAGNPAGSMRANSWDNIAEREFEVSVWDTESGRLLQAPLRRRGWISQLELSPNGEWLAGQFSWVPGSSVIIWNLKSRETLVLSGGRDDSFRRIPARDSEPLLLGIPRIGDSLFAEASVACFAFSPDGLKLAVGYTDGSILIRPLSPGQHLLMQHQKGRDSGARGRSPASIRFTPDGQRLLAAHSDGTVLVWDASHGEARGRLRQKAGGLIECSPDGRLVLLNSVVWDIEADAPMSPEPLQSALRRAAFHPDGAHVFAASSDGHVRIWSLACGIPPAKVFMHDAGLASTHPDDARAQWEALPPVMKIIMPGMPNNIEIVALSPNGRRILTAGASGLARIWETETGKPVTPYLSIKAPVFLAVFDKNAERFFLAGGLYGQTAVGRIWDAQTGASRTPVIALPQNLISAAFTPDGRGLILQTQNEAFVLDARTGQRIGIATGIDGTVRSLAISQDGAVMAVSTRTGDQTHLRLLDTSTGELQYTLSEHAAGEVGQMHFSPDGQWLVTLASDGISFENPKHTAQVLAVKTGKTSGPAISVGGHMPLVTFEREGRLMAIGSARGETILWDLAAGKPLPADEARGLKSKPLAISADLRLVAAASGHELRILETRTGAALAPPLPIESDVKHAVFSPDGRFLVTVLSEQTLVWPLPSDDRPVDDLLYLARMLAGRQISEAGVLEEWSCGDPASFKSAGVMRERVWAWRQRIAKDSESQRLWSAAGFHLEKMIQEGSPDESLRLRQARVKDQAALELLKQFKDAP
jgi:eukaryotic-like serine/threonine-protein kinase